MPAKIKIPASLRKYTQGQDTLECQSRTIPTLLQQIRCDYPDLAAIILDEQDNLNGYIQLYVDGESVRQAGISQSQLTDTSELLLVAPVAGG